MAAIQRPPSYLWGLHGAQRPVQLLVQRNNPAFQDEYLANRTDIRRWCGGSRCVWTTAYTIPARNI
jgi:hypothetical protein